MNTHRGFTLIEVLIAALVLLCGLAATAALFSYAIRANDMNRQSASGALLLYEKMEELRSAPWTDPVWTTAGGEDEIVLRGDVYVRTWQIDSSATPRRVTVIVSVGRNAFSGRASELIRAATLVSPGF